MVYKTISILILIFGLYLIQRNSLNLNASQENSLNLTYLTKNKSLMKIFNRLLPFYRLDSVNYKNSLNSANDLIKVYESAKIGNLVPKQTIDIAEQLQRNIMNYIHSISHSFPTTVVGDYEFQSKVSLLHKITEGIVEDIKTIYEDYYYQNGPDIHTPPPSIRSGPRGNPSEDATYSRNWNFYY